MRKLAWVTAFAQGCPGKLGAAIFVPPPVPKAHLRHVRGGRTERHGLSSPIATLDATTDRRAKSDGVPRWGCPSHPLPITPTPCVQRLRSAVGVRCEVGVGRSKSRTHGPPPSL